jgi:hypothetical protein
MSAGNAAHACVCTARTRRSARASATRTITTAARCHASAHSSFLRFCPRATGLNIGRLEVGGAKLILWDLGGASSLRSIWDKYFAEAHVLVCVSPFCVFLRLFAFLRIVLLCCVCCASRRAESLLCVCLVCGLGMLLMRRRGRGWRRAARRWKGCGITRHHVSAAALLCARTQRALTRTHAPARRCPPASWRARRCCSSRTSST